MSIVSNEAMRNAKCADIAFELTWIVFKEMTE